MDLNSMCCCCCSLFGLRSAAHRLSNGFQALCVYGTSKTDKDLTFTSTALELLEAALVGRERHGYLLVWRPGQVGSGAAAAVAAGESSERAAGQRPPGGRVISWQQFNYTQLAGVYSMLYKTSVPSRATFQGLGGVEQVVEHYFRFIK